MPLRIRGGGLPGGRMEVAADLSSQYVSSILLAAPFARDPVTLALASATVASEPYIDMTVAMMRGTAGRRVRIGLGRPPPPGLIRADPALSASCGYSLRL